MKKGFVLFSALVIFLLGISFVSASLCQGYDGYWHDCSYFESGWKYRTDSPKEVIELKKTTYDYKHRSDKIIITTFERKNKKQYYDGNFYVYSGDEYFKKKDYSKKYVSSSSWRYKEPNYYRNDYDYCIDKCMRKTSRSKRERCVDSCRDNYYYYKPRWDYEREYYNWRW